MSSIAAQLAQSASLNTNFLADRSSRKAGESYLFTGREADQYDLESLHALGVNGLLQLSSLNPALREFEETLFSDHAKATDRTQLTLEASHDLDISIGAFMALLGPYLMENPTGKVLEWLVRRFRCVYVTQMFVDAQNQAIRINEFNLDAVLSLFLPYHESPHFAKMVTILHVKYAINTCRRYLLTFRKGQTRYGAFSPLINLQPRAFLESPSLLNYSETRIWLDS